MMTNSSLKGFIFFLFSCLFAFAAWVLDLTSTSDPEAYRVFLEREIRSAISQSRSDVSSVRAALESGRFWPDVSTSVYHYRNGDLDQWSVYWVEPFTVFPGKDTITVLTTSTGRFLIDQQALGGGDVLAGVIPLSRDKSRLAESQDQAGLISLDLAICDQPVQVGCVWVTHQGAALFPIIPPAGWRSTLRSLGVWCMAFAAFLFSYLGWRQAIASKLSLGGRILILTTCLFGVRVLLLGTGMLRDWSVLKDVFDSTWFASSRLHDSAGSLLFDMVCLTAFASAFRRALLEVPLIRIARQHGFIRKVASVSLTMLLCGLFVFPVVILEVVYRHSVLSLDITESVSFGGPRMSLFLVLLLAGFITYSVTGSVMRYLTVLYRTAPAGTLAVSVLTVVFISTAFWLSGWLWTSVTQLAGLFMVFFLVLIGRFRPNAMFRRRWVAHVFLASSIGLLIAFQIRIQESARQVARMDRFLEHAVSGRDEVIDYALLSASGKIRQDRFIGSVADDPILEKRAITSKVKAMHLGAYLMRESPQVGYYDQSGNGLVIDRLPQRLDELLLEFGVADTGFRAGYHFMAASPSNGFQSCYLALVPVGQFNPGWVAVRLQVPMINLSSAPEQEISGFGVIQSGRLIYSKGTPDYHGLMTSGEIKAGSVKAPFNWVEGGFLHRIVPDSDSPQRFLLASSGAYDASRVLTNASLVLLAGMLLLIIIRCGTGEWSMRHLFSRSYGSRLRLYLLAAFFLPLFSISVVVVRMMSLTWIQEHRVQQRQLVMDMADEVKTLIPKDSLDLGLRDLVIVQSRLGHQTFSLYDSSGVLMWVQDAGNRGDAVVPTRLNATVLSGLRKGAAVSDMVERTGEGDYRVAYAAVRQPGSDVSLAVLAVPDIRGRELQDKAFSDGVRKVVNVALPVFILFLLLSHIMVHRLSLPLRRVGAALRQTSFLSAGDPLGADDGDEMGKLIRSYDRLLVNLSESRSALLARERESAWREMAKRVAHEIRNPLTPIRLTLQRLIHQSRQGTLDPHSTQETLQGVLHQTDVLSGIATSFSDLARQPELTLESFDCVPVVRQSLAVFESSATGVLEFMAPAGSVFISFDRHFLVRVISNLVNNAIHSADRAVEVRVSLSRVDGFAVLEVRDNGAGMAPEVLEKVFQPYFTTRRTGMGLGLTIIRQGVEQCGGRIEAESTSGEGSVFRVYLPAGPPSAH